MQSKLISGGKNSKLIIFFNGWGQDGQVLADCEAGSFDVLAFNDYCNFDTEDLSIFAKYEKIGMVSWSLGVYAGAYFMELHPEIRLDFALGINGTLKVMDEKYGINPEIFQGTIRNWSDEKSRRAFNFRMAGSRENLLKLPESSRDWLNQQQELEALSRLYQEHGEAKNIYRKIIIGAKDRIFPAAAQIAFWEKSGVEMSVMDTLPHYPFFEIKNLICGGEF